MNLQMISPLEAIAWAAGIVALVSISINVIQSNKRKSLTRSLRSRLQSAYNLNYAIALKCDEILFFNDNSEQPPDQKLSSIINQIHHISGMVGASSNDIMAFCREHLKFEPFYEQPPNLPRYNETPKKRRADNQNQVKSHMGGLFEESDSP